MLSQLTGLQVLPYLTEKTLSVQVIEQKLSILKADLAGDYGRADCAKKLYPSTHTRGALQEELLPRDNKFWVYSFKAMLPTRWAHGPCRLQHLVPAAVHHSVTVSTVLLQ